MMKLFALVAFLATIVLAKEEFEGRKILIVGSSAGMGKAAADLVYERGGKIVYSSRRLEKLKGIISDKDPQRAFALQCDAGDIKQVQKTVDAAVELMGGLDGIVWVPTYLGPDSFFPLGSGEGLYSGFMGNYLYNVEYFLRFVEYAHPHLKKEKGASVVGISSIAAEMSGFSPAYSASKAAHEAVVRDLALAYAPEVRVNTFQAGAFDTDIMAAAGIPDEVKEKFLGEAEWRIPLKRFGTAEEAGEIIAFLLSERNGYMTGESLKSDGAALRVYRFTDSMSPNPVIQKYSPPAGAGDCASP